MSEDERRKVLTALVAVQVMFAVHYPVTKVLLRTLEPSAWVALRLMLGALVFVSVFLATKPVRLAGRDLLELAGLSVFGVILNQIGFIEGMARTVPSHSAVINTMIPVLTLTFAVLLRRETFRLRTAVGVAIALTGVLVLLEVDRVRARSEFWQGDLLTLGNAASFSLFLVLSRGVTRRLGPVAATAGVLAFGSLGAAAYGTRALSAVDWASLPPSTFWLIAYAVLFPTVIAYFLNFWALARVESSSVALFVYLQPVIAASISAVWLHEAITARTVVASLLVFAGVVYATRRR
ncbi:MAG: DMT family transporter [bacterium]